MPQGRPCHGRASSGLFQHLGYPVEWSDVLVEAHQPAADDLPRPGAGRAPFLRRERPAAF